MIATARKLFTVASRNRRARVALQALVSLALIVLLLKAVPGDKLAAAWHAVGFQTLLLACACFVLASATSIRRWQIMLRSQGIAENALGLAEVYFIGLFCSLFLPTAAGGDAYRIYEVARRGYSPVRVLLATMQDRLLGLGGTMLLGLIAACYYREVLPANLFLTVLTTYSLGILGVFVLLHQGRVVRLGQWLLGRLPVPRFVTSVRENKTVARSIAFLRPLQEAPPLNLWRTLRVFSLALATFLCAVSMYAVVCHALDVSCDFLALCLVVSLVGLVRMLPISLGGLGLGEEAFVLLAGLFGMAHEKAVLVALAILAVNTIMSLLGGLPLMLRMFLGMQAVAAPQIAAELEPPSVLALPVPQVKAGGNCRHAA
jgi:glycosyltransferase 2 family protein